DKAAADGRKLYVIGTVVGTDNDPQSYADSVQTLKDAGVIVESSNARAIRAALKLMGHELVVADKAHVAFAGEKVEIPTPSEKVIDLLNSKPKVINVGLESFTEPIVTYGGEALQFNWRPRAGGNKKLIRILNEL